MRILQRAACKAPAFWIRIMDIFLPDGTLRGVHLTRRSGTKPMALQISVQNTMGTSLFTTYSVEGVDFSTVWARVVDRLAYYYGIATDSDVYRVMIESRAQFMQKYWLRTRRVVVEYLQVEHME